MPEGLPAGAQLDRVVFSGSVAAAAVSIQSEPPALPSDGMVVVFRHAGDGWVQEALLESPFERPSRFGGALALGDEMLVVGASRAGALAGAVFVYEPGGDGWSATAELPSPDGAASFFGAALAMAGDRMLVSAGNPSIHPGRVIVFEREGGEWTESGRFQAPGGAAQDLFGATLATDGANVFVGAPGVNGGRGAIYETVLGDGGPGPLETVSDGQDGSQLGGRLAYDGGVLVAGNPGADGGLGNAVILAGGPGGWSGGSTLFKDVLEIDAVLGGQIDCAGGEASVFGCNEVDLVAYMPVSQLGGSARRAGQRYLGLDRPGNQPRLRHRGAQRRHRRSWTSPIRPTRFLVGNLPQDRGGAEFELARHEGLQRPRLRGLRQCSRTRHAGSRPDQSCSEYDGEPLALNAKTRVTTRSAACTTS